jgi:hypothetical protein
MREVTAASDTSPMPTPPRRRWFQFSLATMFVVVTVVAVFVAYDANLIRQRRAAKAVMTARGVRILMRPAGAGDLPIGPGVNDNPGFAQGRIPLHRRLMGDQGVAVIGVVEADDVNYAKTNFPEAAIILYDRERWDDLPSWPPE